MISARLDRLPALGSPRTSDSLRLLVALAGVGALAHVAALGSRLSMDGQGIEMLFGFAAIAVACLGVAPRRLVAGSLAAFFSVYGGLSALTAADELRDATATADRLVGPFLELAVANVERAGGVEPATLEAFGVASRLTVVAGLVAIAAALAAEALMRARPGARVAVLTRDAERLGRFFVLVGFAGLGAALLRFLSVGLDGASVFQGIKSFWTGGSYLLAIAHLGIPGFTLWLTSLALAREPWRRWALPATALGIFLLATLPTGQRTFALELGVGALLVLAFTRSVSGRQVASAIAIAFVLLGITQAVRNQIREEDDVSPAGVLERLAPARLGSLYQSQLASFRWTVELAQHRGQMHIGDQLAALLAKPVPRQVYPAKPDGFAVQFTRRLYPDAAAQDINFATPLVAESWFGLGWPGLVAVHLLLGAVLGLAAALVARRAPPVLLPALVMTIAWSGFVFLRGDAANAALAAATWLLPAAVFVLVLARRARRPVERLVIDALQVPAEFSGVGRQLTMIGQGLAEQELPQELVLRCAKDAKGLLGPAFPDAVQIETPLAASRPRWRRIGYQQLIARVRDGSSTLILCVGDQGPVWGRSRVALIVNDVRRLTHPATSPLGERLFYRLLQPAAIRRADALLTISDFSRAELERALGAPTNAIVIREHPRPATGATASAPSDGDILVVGALRPYKGTEDVVRALDRLEAPHTARAVFVGPDEGGLESLLRVATAHDVLERVDIRGWVSEDELRDLRRTALAAVCPSHYEGYGLPLAESLAHGLPTIASSIPPHREIGGDAALWFAPGDADGLANALTEVASRPPFRRYLAARALERSAELAAARPRYAEAVALSVERATRERAPAGLRREPRPSRPWSRRAGSSPTASLRPAPAPAVDSAGRARERGD